MARLDKKSMNMASRGHSGAECEAIQNELCDLHREVTLEQGLMVEAAIKLMKATGSSKYNCQDFVEKDFTWNWALRARLGPLLVRLQWLREQALE